MCAAAEAHADDPQSFLAEWLTSRIRATDAGSESQVSPGSAAGAETWTAAGWLASLGVTEELARSLIGPDSGSDVDGGPSTTDGADAIRIKFGPLHLSSKAASRQFHKEDGRLCVVQLLILRGPTDHLTSLHATR